MKILLIAFLLTAVAVQADSDQAKQLIDAIRKGNGAAVKDLLDSDATLVDSPAGGGVSATRLALYYQHPEIARMLIERGAKLDIYDAASAGELSRVWELVKGDPGLPNSYSGDGAPPLSLAAFFGHREVAEYLLYAGAKPNAVATNSGFPFAPLHSAMSAGHRTIVDLLLARGADVNVREGGGMTVLHEAAGLGSVEYVQLFLARGANPQAKTDDGKTPEDFARSRSHEAVAELLKRARN